MVSRVICGDTSFVIVLKFASRPNISIKTIAQFTAVSVLFLLFTDLSYSIFGKIAKYMVD